MICIVKSKLLALIEDILIQIFVTIRFYLHHCYRYIVIRKIRKFDLEQFFFNQVNVPHPLSEIIKKFVHQRLFKMINY